MRVSEANSGSAASLANKRSGKQGRSDRFSELWRNLERKDPRRRREANNSESGVAQATATGVPAPKPALSSEMTTTSAQTAEAKQTSDLNKLASEIVQHCETVAHNGEIQSLSLTFRSEALAGLQVQVQKLPDGISIRFVTDSPSLLGLLAQNTDQLRGTLSDKGIKVKGVALSTKAGDSLSRFFKGQAKEQDDD